MSSHPKASGKWACIAAICAAFVLAVVAFVRQNVNNARQQQVRTAVQNAERFAYEGVTLTSDDLDFAGMKSALLGVVDSPTVWSFNPDRMAIVSCLDRDGHMIRVELCEDAIVIDGIAFAGDGQVLRELFADAWRRVRKKSPRD